MKNVPTNLSHFRSKVDKIDVHKLVPFPVSLSIISDVQKIMSLRKDVYNTEIKNIENNIPDFANIAVNPSCSFK